MSCDSKQKKKYGNKFFKSWNILNFCFISLSTTKKGEGWHNYHHVFPWDYKTAELGNYRYNITTAFIDFFAFIGWAYDMKTVSPEIIERRAERTGDGSRPNSQYTSQHCDRDAMHAERMSSHLIFGWSDVDLDENDKKYATILNKI